MTMLKASSCRCYSCLRRDTVPSSVDLHDFGPLIFFVLPSATCRSAFLVGRTCRFGFSLAALIDAHVSFLASPDFHEFNVHHVHLCCCTIFAALRHHGLCGSFPNHIESMATQHGRWIRISTSPTHVLVVFGRSCFSQCIHSSVLFALWSSSLWLSHGSRFEPHTCGFLMYRDTTHTLWLC